MNHTAENNAVPLRTRLKERRAAQNPIDRNRGALLIRGRLFTWLATTRSRLRQAGQPVPGNIAAFWDMDQEPGLEPLLTQWVEEEGISVSLPVVAKPDDQLEFRLWTTDTPMNKGAFGILEPDGKPAQPPDVVRGTPIGFN